MKIFATVVLTAILTSAFWIFAFGIVRSGSGGAGGSRVDGQVQGKGDEVAVTPAAAGTGTLAVAESVEVGPAGLAIPVAGIKAGS